MLEVPWPCFYTKPPLPFICGRRICQRKNFGNHQRSSMILITPRVSETASRAGRFAAGPLIGLTGSESR
jgi:hypothetical protein